MAVTVARARYERGTSTGMRVWKAGVGSRSHNAFKQKQSRSEFHLDSSVSPRVQVLSGRYSGGMNTRADASTGWEGLFGRLRSFDELSEVELGFEPPRPAAVAVIENLLRSAQEVGMDPDPLHVFPDEDGHVELVRRDGDATISVVTDGEGPFELYFSRVGQRTYERDASTPLAALATLFT